MTINITPCNAAQLSTLRDISIETYHDTFNDSNSDALMQQYFQESLSLKQLSAELATVGSRFYFLYCDNEIAGFVKINVDDAQSDDIQKEALEIARFYIRKHCLRQGLGKHLMDFCCSLAKQLNKPCIWLGVWEGNGAALAFYKRMGFYHIGSHPFDMAGDIQTDFIMKKDL